MKGIHACPSACGCPSDAWCMKSTARRPSARARPRAGILYAKYKSNKLMEHLKLFSARLNIPRLIRACEEQHHWRELVFLYVAYDEYDNAALVMMAHSPAAWEHVQFKDVAVKARANPAWGRVHPCMG